MMFFDLPDMLVLAATDSLGDGIISPFGWLLDTTQSSSADRSQRDQCNKIVP